MTISKHFVLAAGGTGGHMIPAYALARELLNRGHRVALITDDRGLKIPGCPDEVEIHALPAGRLQGGPLGWFKAFRAIMKGREMAGQLYSTFQPSAVVGFGGYPSLPALLAASKAGISSVIHEQNAVLGRTNRFLAGKVDAIATAYTKVDRLAPKYASKVHMVGNPVREAILTLREEDYPACLEDGLLRVLVTGGSLGASILSDIVPDALSKLPVNLRRRLQVTHQARAEDIETVRAKYAEHEIPAELATYIADMPAKLSWAHLVIARAGASTVAELSVAGRPAILIPLPTAMDDHQSGNVRDLVAAGGARSMRQPLITMKNLDSVKNTDERNRLAKQKSETLDAMSKEMCKQIQKIALNPETLKNAAQAAWKCGMPDAASDLADLVERSGGAAIADTITVVRPGAAKGAVVGRASVARVPADQEFAA